MHARIATYRGATSDDLDAFLPHLAERVEHDLGTPELAGLREILVLVDRAQGRALSVTLFDSEDDMDRAEVALGRMPMTQAGAVRTEVERYEIALRRSRT